MSKKWASYTFSLFLKHKMSYTSQGRRKNKPQTFSADGWTGESKIFTNVVKNEQELPSPEPRTARISELNGSSGGRGKGIRGPRSFVPVGTTNWDQRPPPFVSVGGLNRDKRQLSTPLARLAVGPRTKATFCPEPKGSRDKWPRTKSMFCSSAMRRYTNNI